MTAQSKSPVYIATYTGYRHSRYDGYQSSWGVLMALGASPTADCFADEDDYPDESFDLKFESEIPAGEIDKFNRKMLQNLDASSLEEILEELSEEGYFKHLEFWGNQPISVEFTKQVNGIYVECNDRKYKTDLEC